MKLDPSCHRDFFHHHQLKNTPARDLVYHLLQDNQPITLDKLFKLVSNQSKGEKISHSTVFRILEQFSKVHIVEKMTLETESTPLYQIVNQDHHHHQLVCTSCKKIIAIEDCPLGKYEKKIANQHQFLINHHQFTLYGLCQHCQDNSR
jgi:Fur family transcriptional regulator, ferric uptake regulator